KADPFLRFSQRPFYVFAVRSKGAVPTDINSVVRFLPSFQDWLNAERTDRTLNASDVRFRIITCINDTIFAASVTTGHLPDGRYSSNAARTDGTTGVTMKPIIRFNRWS